MALNNQGGRSSRPGAFATRLGRRNISRFDPIDAVALLERMNSERVSRMAHTLKSYIDTNLPNAIANRASLAAYRINPYVVIASAGALELSDVSDFSQFLVHSKFYAGLETSFGKSIEDTVMANYPIDASRGNWTSPPEKAAEFQTYAGLNQEERTRARNNSVWREIDRSYIGATRRYLLSIKSGPDTINDTQVEAMRSAIVNRHAEWLRQSRAVRDDLVGVDVVIGLTYGTNKRTNNKENQILTKLLGSGFEEEDPDNLPGVLERCS